MTAALDAYRFNEAAQAIYRFVWDRFCDWYLELAKPVLDDGGPAADETRATAAWVLDRVCHLLHPMMPFVTESLREQLLEAEPHTLIAQPWPEAVTGLDGSAGAEIDWLITLITEIRGARAELRVPAGAKLDLWVDEPTAELRRRLATWRAALQRLARVATIREGLPSASDGTLQVVVDATTFVLPLAGHVDLAEERARLDREAKKAKDDVAAIARKLQNPQFVAKAPENVVEQQRERQAAGEATLKRLEAAIARIAQ